ncbi:porphobilinogen deaminase, dipyromethane cofactor binding domain-containing protein [Blyttiomyces helicus]|uniref:hydroxymethylbilane synthase n=1 Tax=Blyttiomyces helicus TaxID=388810 RepID=A0A4P9W9K9_9FUNG|nr:porphobilinogen deaminase, dipyromethane cofactor binding domain-containing protein [Blyttiomyces helicus]|eukprot:RKO89239.1 porphobilinogen deaminase, dipyromethane cofactor binding domain-containing protein [Blyttiomyces helicus]
MSAQTSSPIVIGTRESQLAMVQATHVQARLQAAFPDHTFLIKGMTTLGDQVQDVALSKIGSKALFTKELEVALHNGSVDLVVHSLKDLPSLLPPGMVVGAILEREDPRDAVIMRAGSAVTRLEDLEEGSVVGTSSVRRSAQIRARFPGLRFEDVRGNLNTRLKKLDAPDSPYACLLLAFAGVHRLGWDSRISQILPPTTMLHAVGQGALGIECRSDDDRILSFLSTLDDRATRLRCTAERGFMRALEGGCSVPLGVWSELENGALKLVGSVTSLDGKVEARDEAFVTIEGRDRETDVGVAEALGHELAAVLVGKGAKVILDEIISHRVKPVDSVVPWPAPASKQPAA